jgi:cysteinyl-tRNA synthetase
MPQALQLYNTLTRTKEVFKPISSDHVGVYTCGPTPYNFAHVGNLKPYFHWDVLVKTLKRFGYKVTQVMNVTDVGHLTSDADEGDDKMMVAMRREGKSPWDIAKFYEAAFFKDCGEMNIARPDVVCRATEHIAEMIEMVKCIEKMAIRMSLTEMSILIRKSSTWTRGLAAKLGLVMVSFGAARGSLTRNLPGWKPINGRKAQKTLFSGSANPSFPIR